MVPRWLLIRIGWPVQRRMVWMRAEFWQTADPV